MKPALHELSPPPSLLTRLEQLRAARQRALGTCPACAGEVQPDGHAIRLHGAFFHVGCALSRRGHAA